MSREAASALEVWRPIAGFEKLYEVSNCGRIRRISSRKGATAGKILGQRPNKDGYSRVGLHNAPNPPVEKLVHILVLEHFVGPCPPGMEACHNDGDPANAALDNLRWDTPQNNAIDKRRHGKTAGSRHWNSRLTDEQVDQIRAAVGSQRTIARSFGISQQTVSDIKRGKRRAPFTV